jgi:hypothetical protein
VLTVSLAACRASTSPSGSTSPSIELNGRWAMNLVDVTFVLALAQRDGIVTGSGTWWNNGTQENLGIEGTYSPPQVTLTFRYDTGTVCQFAATLPDANTLSGVETCPGKSPGNLFLSRQ